MSYGQPDKIKEILQSLGFNHKEIFNVLQNTTDESSTINFYDHKSQTPKVNPNAHLPKNFKTNASLGAKKSQLIKNQSKYLSSNTELLAEQSTVISVNTIFNILDSVRKKEVSYKNKNLFRTLANFIRRNSDFLLEKGPY